MPVRERKKRRGGKKQRSEETKWGRGEKMHISRELSGGCPLASTLMHVHSFKHTQQFTNSPELLKFEKQEHQPLVRMWESLDHTYF